MATVWRARDTILDRIVAIKRPNPAPDDSAALFSREARAAASVTHPNLVAVYDTGVDETGPYLVMELIDGPSLADADVPPDEIARIGAEVASALAALHQAGVAHGDVKPANIMLAPGGAKLTDFGIARVADDAVTLTRPGVALGTPAYAAPETTSRAERSVAGDVYSLAVTLHELLTGSRWNDSVGMTQAMPAPEWARILTPALAVEPADRPTAAAFATSLATLDAEPDPAPPTVPIAVTSTSTVPLTTPTAPHPPTRRGIGVGVLTVLAVLAVATIVIVLALALGDRDATSVVQPGTSAPAIADTGSTPPPSSTASATPPTSPAVEPAAAPPTAPAAVTPVATEPGTDLAAELVALIEAVPANELKPKDSRDLIDRISSVVRTASNEPDRAESELGEAAEQIADQVDDDATREQAERLLVELADALQLPSQGVTDAFDRSD